MNLQIPADSVPIGYSALVDRYALRVIPHHRWSFVATKGMPRELNDGRVVLRSGFADPSAMTEVDHLTFSLKHDGGNLEILAAVFGAIGDRAHFDAQLVAALQETPNGIYLRRLWFFYEWLTDHTVAMDPMKG